MYPKQFNPGVETGVEVSLCWAVLPQGLLEVGRAWTAASSRSRSGEDLRSMAQPALPSFLLGHPGEPVDFPGRP